MNLNLKEIRVLVLSAGKINSELEKIFGSIPSGLIPLNGKPVIFRIIDKLLNEGFEKISITAGYKKEILEKIVREQYEERCNIEFISTDYEKPPGNSIKTAMDLCTEKKLLVILGDTLIENNFSDLVKRDENVVITSQNFIDSKNWCIVTKKDNKIDEIFDKEELSKDKKYHVLVGCYFFNQVQTLKKIIDGYGLMEKLEISGIINKLKEEENVVTELAQKWHDVGHLENYFSTKQFVLKTRYFNSLQFDDLGENVIKTSKDNKKLINEINWYKNIPNDILDLVPKIKESDVSKNPFIKLEYVKHPTLSELWLYSDFPLEFWGKIIEELLEIIKKFKNHKEDVSKEEYYSIYFQKTVDRIDELIKKNEIFDEIFDNEYVTINGNKLKNWSLIKENVEKKIDEIYNKEDNCLIHGDFYFSNILYDSETSKYKLIDPRGVWGNGMSGDIKYDIAKIRHSVIGGFDTITNGLYTVSYEKTNGIDVNVFQPQNYEIICKELDTQIEKYWKLDEIKMIEGLLFISMLPLHEDNFERQLVFFAIGIQRLNEIFGD